MIYKNYPMVSRVVFGRGSFNQLDEILALKRNGRNAPFIFYVDDVFKDKHWLISRITLSYKDKIIYIPTKEEPKTSQIDQLVEDIIDLLHIDRYPRLVSRMRDIINTEIIDQAEEIAKMKIEEAAAKKQARIDSKKDTIVAVNAYKLDKEDQDIEILEVDNTSVLNAQLKQNLTYVLLLIAEF